MQTGKLSLYKIWKTLKGRSLKRWLTYEAFAHYQRTFPHWRWEKIGELQSEDRVVAAAKPQAKQNCSRWGLLTQTHELFSNRGLLNDSSVPKISYDDILDVQLALNKKGV